MSTSLLIRTRLDQLEKRIRELEARPVYVPVPYPALPDYMMPAQPWVITYEGTGRPVKTPTFT